MYKLKVRSIFAAVLDKSTLDPLLEVLRVEQKARLFSKLSSSTKPGFGAGKVRFLGTEGTVKYLKKKGFEAKSVVSGFDFNGRLKSIDKKVFAGILGDRSKKRHMDELKKLARHTSEVRSRRRQGNTSEVEAVLGEPIDVVIVDLYKPQKKNFPESMDIGGQALIRAAIKNYKNVALAFDAKSIKELANEVKSGSTTEKFRIKQAKKAAKFVADRGKLESSYF